MTDHPVLTFDEFARRYCERQVCTVAHLRLRLTHIAENFAPDGFMLLECAMLDSSRLGSLTILPYGGHATYARIPDHPISPRGLASDMSVVVAILPVSALGRSGLRTAGDDAMRADVVTPPYRRRRDGTIEHNKETS